MAVKLEDRHRSLRRWVYMAMGDPWIVRLVSKNLPDVQRPAGLVEPVPAGVSGSGRSTMQQGWFERSQAFAIMLYPSFTDPVGSVDPGEVTAVTADEAAQRARAACDRLDAALAHGLAEELADGEPERWLWNTPPGGIPLFSYDGVPLGQPGPAAPFDWMTFVDPVVRLIQDQDDVLRWTVACTLTVSWMDAGRARPTSELVGTMPGEFDPEP